jgi:hypothetical protein
VSNLNRKLAIQYLSQNIQPSVVAGILGVTESAISQLLADPDFATEVSEASQGAAAEDLGYDKRVDEAEDQFLKNIEQRAPFANMQQSLQAFKLLNGAKRRRDTRVHQSAGNSGVTVNITLPASIVPQYVMNAQAEIVEVSGQTMISATPANVNAMLEARRSADPAAVKSERALAAVPGLTNKPVRVKPPLIDLL